MATKMAVFLALAGDLTATIATAAVLYHRIWAAAVYVCKPYNANLGGKVAWDSCRDATIAYSVARFNLPALREFYTAKINRQKLVLLLSP